MPPTALINSLHSIRRRAKVLSIALGVGLTVTAAVGSLLAAVFLDYWLNLPSIPRCLVILAALFALAWALRHWLVPPILARLSLGDVAGRLEETFPTFDDRLRSTVNFSAGRIPGSQAMQDRVIDEATRMAGEVDLGRAIVMRPVWLSALAAVSALLLLGFLASLDPQTTRIAVSRLLNPLGGLPWPKRVQIAADALPDRVPVGRSLPVRMTLLKGYRPGVQAIVHYQYDNGREQQEYMTLGEDHAFTAALDSKGRRITVWIEAGDDQTPPKEIVVVPRLEVQGVELVVKPPAYAKLPPATLNLAGAPAVITLGSELALRLTFNKVLDADRQVRLAPVAAGMVAPAAQWDHPSAVTAVARWTAHDSVTFRVHAVDADGFENSGIQEYQIIVHPDQMPTVVIEQPRKNLDRAPEAVVPLQVLAEDDFGFRSMKLVVNRLLGDKKHWEIPLGNWEKIDASAERVRFRVRWDWDLSQLPDAHLQPGDVLEYFVQVQDNYESTDAAGQREVHPFVSSGRLRINIVSQDQIARSAADAIRAMAYQVNEVKNAQARTAEETRQFHEDTQGKESLDKSDREAADKLVNQQTTVASQTKTLAGEMNAILDALNENRSPATELKDLARDVADELNHAAENPMKDAVGQITKAAQQEPPPHATPAQHAAAAAERNDALTQGGQSQQSALEALEQTLDRMGNVGALPEMIKRWEDILKKQQDLRTDLQAVSRDNLGKKPDDMSDADRAKLEKNAADQAALAQQTDQTARDMQKAGEGMEKSDPADAEAMKQAAAQAQQQNVAGNQQEAAQQARENQQAQAQSAGQQAELGLQVVINTLREAQRHKLEHIMQQLDDTLQAIANLIRRQAGHNIDDLGLQGAARLQLVTDALLEKAERARDHQPPLPQPPQLTASQEQTERNTRDVSKSVGDLPGGPLIGSDLIRAARRMGQAITELRDRDLIGAYDPHMVQALAALDDAQAKAQNQRDAAQSKLDQQQKDAIREVFIKIKADQDALNAQTKDLDAAPRLPDGNLKRQDAIRLGQLPGKQGQLADRCRDVGEDLDALDSVVYSWANHDIIKSMDQIKDDLGKPQTGPPTQEQQQRVSAQLAAMIENLALKPPDPSKFDSGGGGGGGGGQPPKNRLPTEAELRLLRSLQLVINDSTKSTDALSKEKREKSSMVALGDRQGELRGLLDQLLRKNSNGVVRLGPEPDKKDQLPEEAGDEQIEDQEMEKLLLQDKTADDAAQRDVNLIGDRMSRSRVRLADDGDPGPVTQKIQERIIQNLDDLIRMARSQSRQAPSGKGSGQKQAPAQPTAGQPHNAPSDSATGSKPNKAQSPAQGDAVVHTDENAAVLSQIIKETAAEWGQISPRTHDAVVEGQTETAIPKYQKMIEDYYRSLAIKATESK